MARVGQCRRNRRPSTGFRLDAEGRAVISLDDRRPVAKDPGQNRGRNHMLAAARERATNGGYRRGHSLIFFLSDNPQLDILPRSFAARERDREYHRRVAQAKAGRPRRRGGCCGASAPGPVAFEALYAPQRDTRRIDLAGHLLGAPPRRVVCLELHVHLAPSSPSNPAPSSAAANNHMPFLINAARTACTRRKYSALPKAGRAPTTGMSASK